MTQHLPHWDGQTMHLTTPGNTTMSTGEQRAARGTYIWSADDPMVFSFHMEVAMTSVPMDPRNFAGVTSEHDVVLCPRCSNGIAWDEFCVPVRIGNGPGSSVWCMACAEQHEFADITESIWVLGIDFLATACEHEDYLGIPEQATASHARVWRSGPMNLTFAFTQGENTMLYMTDAQGSRLFLDAVRDYSKRANFQEAYLMGGVAALEALANKEA